MAQLEVRIWVGPDLELWSWLHFFSCLCLLVCREMELSLRELARKPAATPLAVASVLRASVLCAPRDRLFSRTVNQYKTLSH